MERNTSLSLKKIFSLLYLFLCEKGTLSHSGVCFSTWWWWHSHLKEVWRGTRKTLERERGNKCRERKREQVLLVAGAEMVGEEGLMDARIYSAGPSCLSFLRASGRIITLCISEDF
ncbi:hypothetical protein AMTRI_Chr08g166910 [Amborella trichopoda]